MNCLERKAGKHKRQKNLLRKETTRNHQCHNNWIHLAQSRASYSYSNLETFISKSPTTTIPDKNKKKGLTDLRELTSTAGDIVLLCTSDTIINRIEILLVLKKKKIQVETNLVIHHSVLARWSGTCGMRKWQHWNQNLMVQVKKSASKKTVRPRRGRLGPALLLPPLLVCCYISPSSSELALLLPPLLPLSLLSSCWAWLRAAAAAAASFSCCFSAAAFFSCSAWLFMWALRLFTL